MSSHEADEELLIDYGTRASHRLLRLYGCVPGPPPGSDEVEAEAAAEEAGATTHDIIARQLTGGATGDAARNQSASVIWHPGDEIQLPLLPSAAELAGAPESVLAEMSAARAALAACGVRGSSLRLQVKDDGRVELPPFVTATGAGGAAEAATARRVLRGGVEAQQLRLKQGVAACAAVKAMAGSSGDAASGRRASLCERLHLRESAVLDGVVAALKQEGAQA